MTTKKITNSCIDINDRDAIRSGNIIFFKIFSIYNFLYYNYSSTTYLEFFVKYMSVQSPHLYLGFLTVKTTVLLLLLHTWYCRVLLFRRNVVNIATISRIGRGGSDTKRRTRNVSFTLWGLLDGMVEQQKCCVKERRRSRVVAIQFHQRCRLVVSTHTIRTIFERKAKQ